MSSDDHSLLEPWYYIRAMPGKNIRAIMVDAFQQWLNIPQDKINVIKDIVGTLHDASLLIDDIEDNSELRRGQPVAHSIFGVPSTINCANFVFFLALEQCNKLGSQKAMDIYISEMINLHRGQGQDILWRDTTTCPTEEEYKAMVINKTGGLFRLAVGLMQAFSTSTKDFIPLVNKLGLYFQVRDDYINLIDTKYMEHKSFCEDLTEGKFSFPLIYGIRKDPNDHRLLSILKQRTTNRNVKEHAVKYLEENGAFEYTKSYLEQLYTDILNEIEALGGNVQLVGLVNKLHSTLKTQ
ncbi:geranylgeranyl pyrophosphate synthetase [Thraustotheca clavata]|uniref:Geranylgeranyl pyrophosphate synthetase n=1 Tax=Thraustotheca clavata TaxID=74557 RepID=A0A1V9Z5R1_9STRA|nr:geranylgeranyl pyrophosphate synthetase [Thraustotheca clavata]